jgi:hypothetical protein
MFRYLSSGIAAASLILDGQIWGTNPTGYHLTNLLLHLACSGPGHAHHA